MAETQIPLNHEASLGETNQQITSELPPEVVQCLENARFLHLATCTNNIPHVSLMNYTYLPSSPFSAAPVIVMTTNPASKKSNNLVANPNVSLLVHDWVSHRPSTTQRRMSGGSPGPESRSSLAALLFSLNTSAVSSISATINGSARLVDRGSDEEAFYRSTHLENNTFEPEAGASFQRGGDSVAPGADAAVREDGSGQEAFVAGEEVCVITVSIRDVRIADRKGNVRDWVLLPPGQGGAGGSVPTVNGV